MYHSHCKSRDIPRLCNLSCGDCFYKYLNDLWINKIKKLYINFNNANITHKIDKSCMIPLLWYDISFHNMMTLSVISVYTTLIWKFVSFFSFGARKHILAIHKFQHTYASALANGSDSLKIYTPEVISASDEPNRSC